MSLKAEDFPDVESFSIAILEYPTERRGSAPEPRVITEFEKVGKIAPAYSYSPENLESNSYSLGFRFKGMYEKREEWKKIRRCYDDHLKDPPKHRHITRVITYTIKYKGVA